MVLNIDNILPPEINKNKRTKSGAKVPKRSRFTSGFETIRRVVKDPPGVVSTLPSVVTSVTAQVHRSIIRRIGYRATVSTTVTARFGLVFGKRLSCLDDCP